MEQILSLTSSGWLFKGLGHGQKVGVVEGLAKSQRC
jgi:hypothetical protein